MTTRDLFIVSTDRTELYALLKRGLADRDNVEVILDRRRAARGEPSGSTREERRRAERSYYDEAQLLKSIGVVLVPRDRRPPRSGGVAV
jgi:hypothetical protein